MKKMIAVEAKADHTGYVALAVFDDQFNEPLEIYGGPKDAPFTWQVTADGHVILTDPSTGESISTARTRSDASDHSDFVDIGQIDCLSVTTLRWEKGARHQQPRAFGTHLLRRDSEINEGELLIQTKPNGETEIINNNSRAFSLRLTAVPALAACRAALQEPA